MRVYLAATSELYTEKSDRIGINCNVDRLLVSFMSRTWTTKRLMNAVDRTSAADFCVDSGAHVWLSKYFKTGEKPPLDKVLLHLHGFLAAVEAMPRKPTFVVELDLQRIYGMELIEKWRHEIWRPFEKRTGIRVCYVWHVTDGDRMWQDFLADDEVNYLGLGSKGNITIEQRARLVHGAYEAGKPVHGFASVNGDWIKHVPYYSVDSTSWAAGTFFGTVPSFNPMTGVVQQTGVGRSTFKAKPRLAIGRLAKAAKGKIKIDTLTESDGKKQDFSAYYQHAADNYARFEQWYTAYWRARGVDWEARLEERARVLASG